MMNNTEIKTLCKKLLTLSGKRKNVNDMFMLFCYIKPNVQCKKAEVSGTKPPSHILCYKNQGGDITYPSMLMELLNN